MKLDISTILSKLDQNDMRVYNSVGDTKAARNELDKNVSWMIPQWMTGSYDAVQQRNLVILFDELCNPGWSVFYKHPELQTKLLAAMGNGRTKHRFYRPSGGKISKYPELIELLQSVYEDIRDDEVVLWCHHNDIKDLDDMMDQVGMSLDSRKPIRAQFIKAIT